MGLRSTAQQRNPLLGVASVEVARNVAVAVLVFVVHEAHVLPIRRPRFDLWSVSLEEREEEGALERVGMAKVLADELPKNHGVARDLVVVQLAASAIAGIKVARLVVVVVADGTAIKDHEEVREEIDGQNLEDRDLLNVIAVHVTGAGARLRGWVGVP